MRTFTPSVSYIAHRFEAAGYDSSTDTGTRRLIEPISKSQESEAAPSCAEKSALNKAETLELQSLFELIADTCDAASMALETGSDLQRLKGMIGRIDSMVGLAKSMLA